MKRLSKGTKDMIGFDDKDEAWAEAYKLELLLGQPVHIKWIYGQWVMVLGKKEEKSK